MPSGHVFAVGLVSSSSELGHKQLLISWGEGALMDGQQQRCSARTLTPGLPGLRHLQAMSCTASGQLDSASTHHGQSHRGSGWMSPARGRQSLSADLISFASVSTSLYLLQRVQTAFPGAILEGSTNVCFSAVPRGGKGQVVPWLPGRPQLPAWQGSASAQRTAAQTRMSSSRVPRGTWTPQLGPQMDVPEWLHDHACSPLWQHRGS